MAAPGLSPNGSLFLLPPELRNVIYKHVLVSVSPSVSYGKGSGVQPALLSTCKQIHDEAVGHLYSAAHVLFIGLPDAPLIPHTVLSRFQRISLRIHYSSFCFRGIQTGVSQMLKLCTQTAVLGLMLARSPALRELHICLTDLSPRFGSLAPVPDDDMSDEMRNLLAPFALLPRSVGAVEVSHPDTAQWSEMFEGLRATYLSGGEYYRVPPWHTFNDVWVRRESRRAAEEQKTLAPDHIFSPVLDARDYLAKNASRQE